ncbi:tetratricopeptide repeat protein [Rhizobium laguerreae]|uniref:tetratricopeptide repeat protein n=1 Tax=Rhizobium laguerreae TaxID=1076926 RepID=UPI00147843D1|nr:tetratricopeptide repeat protein [Rhizobium laguerreae]NNG70095.1 tetratricopeptide repeat protein [Rhizobium laguerreae]
MADHIKDVWQRGITSLDAPNVGSTFGHIDITVPVVNLSSTSVLQYVEQIFGFHRQNSVTGEIYSLDQKLHLRLRYNGLLIFESRDGVNNVDVEKILNDAAQAVLDQSVPYANAVVLYSLDKHAALEKVEDIISSLPLDDINVRWAKTLKAIIYIDQKNYDEAEHILRGVIRAHSDFWIAYRDLGFLYYLRERDSEATPLFLKALEINEQDSFSWTKLGQIDLKAGDISKAVREFRAALDLSPKDYEIKFLLGSAVATVATNAAPSEKARLSEEACRLFISASLHQASVERYRAAIVQLNETLTPWPLCRLPFPN